MLVSLSTKCLNSYFVWGNFVSTGNTAANNSTFKGPKRINKHMIIWSTYIRCNWVHERAWRISPLDWEVLCELMWRYAPSMSVKGLQRWVTVSPVSSYQKLPLLKAHCVFQHCPSSCASTTCLLPKLGKNKVSTRTKTALETQAEEQASLIPCSKGKRHTSFRFVFLSNATAVLNSSSC